MKKLIFLLILVIGLINKETKAVSTELFACPTARILKNGECVLGYRFITSTFFIYDIMYMRIGILNFLETDLLANLLTIRGSLKLVLLKEKKNLPQIAFWLNGGIGGEEKRYLYDSFGVVFSKKIQNWQLNASIFKGRTPPVWVESFAYYNEKYSFHTSLERSLGNLKLIVELHNLPPERNISIVGTICRTKNFNFKLGHVFLKKRGKIEYVFPFLSIEYEKQKNI